MRPGLRIPTGSNARLREAVSAITGLSSGWNTSIAARAGASARIRVA